MDRKTTVSYIPFSFWYDEEMINDKEKREKNKEKLFSKVVFIISNYLYV